MDIYEAIRHRRSHRLYRPDLLPREVLERVIEAALWAPSGMNLQAWEITVMAGKVRDEFVALCSQAITHLLPIMQKAQVPEKGQQLVMKFFKDLGGAPVVLAVTIDKNPLDPSNHANLQSGAALMQNLLLAAHAEGLGSCWMTGVAFVEQEILDFLGKPQPATAGHHPHGLLGQRAAGAAAETPGSALAGVLIKSEYWGRARERGFLPSPDTPSQPCKVALEGGTKAPTSRA